MSFRYDTPCSHGFLLWFDGEGGYWHDMGHTQQCDDPNASAKRFGIVPALGAVPTIIALVQDMFAKGVL